ncbi:hypothetical protein IMSAG249_01463 [Lachnospiraceae bacterium]|jgi:Bacterial surface proteins containing Ig-like domains|nr:hypothetical protein IMSAGC009_01862 [Lachnospiraceae bacterium]GFI69638.1 hypothetical protein IMSAG249_01463 [Lachnospiraceae bacterium]
MTDLAGLGMCSADKWEVEMKKKKFAGIVALMPFVMHQLAVIPASAEVIEYQQADTGTEETSAECQVVYKSTYDFSETIPKYPELEISAYGYEGIYDGKFHGITVDCEINGVTVLYSTDGKTFTEKKPAYKDAGTYVIYYKAEKDGYGTALGAAVVKIKEAVIDFTSYDYSGLYDGKLHGIGLSIQTDGCRILYSEDGVDFSSKKPEYREPGTYVVYYKILKDNYETVTGSNRVIITEKDFDIKLSDTGGTVKVNDSIDFTVDTDGEPFDIIVSDSSIVKATVKDGIVTVTGLKKGTAEVTITCNGKSIVYKINVTDRDISSYGNTVTSKNTGNGWDKISDVQTGDENNILLYGALLIASVSGLITLKRRKEK